MSHSSHHHAPHFHGGHHRHRFTSALTPMKILRRHIELHDHDRRCRWKESWWSRPVPAACLAVAIILGGVSLLVLTMMLEGGGGHGH